MISVIVNGKPQNIVEGTTLAELLESQKPAGGPVVIELNGRITKKRDYRSVQLKHGDKIEIVTLVGGG